MDFTPLYPLPHSSESPTRDVSNLNVLQYHNFIIRLNVKQANVRGSIQTQSVIPNNIVIGTVSKEA